MPKVSVIIPAYNRAYIINEAIKSVLSQTFVDFEVLIIDDGSTDTTQETVKSVEDPRVKYFYKENGGVSSARNMGIANSTGEYIAFLDTDDLWPEDYLDKILTYFNNDSEINIVYCLTTTKNSDGKITDSGSYDYCHSGYITANLFVNSVIWPSGTVVRKSLLEGVFFDEILKNSEDSDLFLRLSVGTKIQFAQDVKVLRGSSKDSLSKACGINCSRILVLERFYYKLEGKTLVPKNIAMKKLSHACRRVAERFRKIQYKNAALLLYKRAIGYYPFDVRIYIGLFKALLISKKDDSQPNWKMPEPLGMI